MYADDVILHLQNPEDYTHKLQNRGRGHPGLGSGQAVLSGSVVSSCVCVCVCVCARAQSYPTLCDSTDSSLPGSSVHGFSRQEY